MENQNDHSESDTTRERSEQLKYDNMAYNILLVFERRRMRVYNSNTFTNVVREGDKLNVETVLLSTDEEAATWICCDVRNLVVEKGFFEIYNSPKDMNVFGELTALVGTQAYLGNGVAIREALANGAPEIAKKLVLESIRAVVQAETFLISERGYTSKDAYDHFWEESYAGSCLFYSKSNQVETWINYVGAHERRHNLNSRIQNVAIYKDDTGYQILLAFVESFHEISMRLNVRLDGIVTEVSSDFVRAPGNICKESAHLVSGLIGYALHEIDKRKIASIVGGSIGCVHLTDLIDRAKDALRRCIT